MAPVVPSIVIAEAEDSNELFLSPVQTHQGFAFEVPIKSPSKSMPSVRQRLEERLLSCATPASPLKARRPEPKAVVKDRVQKAHEKNELKRQTTERAEAEIAERKLQLVNEVTSKAERAAKNREETLTSRRTKAAKHFEDVHAKKEVCQRQRADDAEALLLRLSGLSLQKEALHASSLAKRGAYASKHNNKVARKVFQHLVKKQDSTDDVDIFVNAVKTPDGFSFEIPVKSTQIGTKGTPAKRCFEQRLRDCSGVAVGSFALSKASPQRETVQERAEKAHEKNKKKCEAAECARAKATERTVQLQGEVTSKVERATKRHEEVMTCRRRKAGKHFTQVEEKKGVCQQRLLDDSEARMQHLCKLLGQKNALYVAFLAKKRAHARQHNDRVAGKVFEHQVKRHESKEEIESFVNPVETAEGFSFEIPISSPLGAKAMPSLRQRSETATTSLGAAGPPASPLPRHETPSQRAERAQRQNEQKRLAGERAQQTAIERKQQLRSQVMAKVERAVKKQEEVLTERGTTAGKHFKMVVARRELCHQQCADSALASRARLRERASHTDALYDSSLACRRAYAGQHNKVVAGKVRKLQLKQLKQHVKTEEAPRMDTEYQAPRTDMDSQASQKCQSQQVGVELGEEAVSGATPLAQSSATADEGAMCLVM